MIKNILSAFAHHRHNRITSETRASELLYDWNHNILLNSINGTDLPLPTGEYLITRNTFNHLAKIVEGNPMADQRKDGGWLLKVDRGGLITNDVPSITCQLPDHGTIAPGQVFTLRFICGSMQHQL